MLSLDLGMSLGLEPTSWFSLYKIHSLKIMIECVLCARYSTGTEDTW